MEHSGRHHRPELAGSGRLHGSGCLCVLSGGHKDRHEPLGGAVLDMLVVGVVAGVIFFPSLILRGPYFTRCPSRLPSPSVSSSSTRSSSAAHPVWACPSARTPLRSSALPARCRTTTSAYHDGGRLPHHEEDRPLQAGLCARTIREDEDAAAAIGINPTKYKVIAVVISPSLPVWSASSTSATSATSTPML